MSCLWIDNRQAEPVHYRPHHHSEYRIPSPLSNVRVNFGGGETLDLGTMEPRQKVIVSPPPNNSMEFVHVSADPGVFVSKAYGNCQRWWA